MAAKPRPKKNGYKMPAPISTGFIVKNTVQKKAWKIGTSIGKGGFGEIYCCTPVDVDGSSKSKSNSYPYVMKVEPKENGPLFVEMHFYLRNAKKENIESWMQKKGIKRLGMPCYLGSGNFDYKNETFRYLVIDRFGQDLWSVFVANNKIFPCSTALQVGLQIVDVLEYIHEQGYAHCDVKGENLLLGTQRGTEDQVYLVDFGLVSSFTTKEYKPDPKKAHNGTLQYTSRDAHAGVVTRRGDMEILGYNLLHWTTSSLPWEGITVDKAVEEKKKALMGSVSSSTKKLTPSAPPVVVTYLDYVSKLKHDQAPDYDYCRNLFKGELKKLGVPSNGKLNFSVGKAVKKTPQKTSRVPAKKTRGAALVANGQDSSEEDEEEEDEPQPPVPKKTARKPKEKGPSWKDCATAVASNVVKAGEYISSNPKPTKRPKKQ